MNHLATNDTWSTMAYPYYEYDFPPPIVDHLHQRLHQHRTLIQHLLHQQPTRPIDHPNQPDVDVRDAGDLYLIEIELPGVKDRTDVGVRWTGKRSLFVSGKVGRPDDEVGEGKKVDEDSGLKRESELDLEKEKTRSSTSVSSSPTLLVGERKIGSFRRHFWLPVDIDKERVEAKLEAGLLRLRLPKVPVVEKKDGDEEGDGSLHGHVEVMV